MSVDTSIAAGAIPPGAGPLFARAAAAGRRDDARLTAAVADVLLGDERLDDRTRTAVAARLAATVEGIQATIAARLGRTAPSVLPLLADAGLLRDPEMMAALIGRVGIDLLAEALATHHVPDDGRALIARLVDCGDAAIEAAARAYLLADNRRHDGDLPPPLHARLVWRVAAALVTEDADTPALVEAASREASAETAAPLETAAARLATAIGARNDEIGGLLIDALAEGHAALFVAVLAHALALEDSVVRDVVLDPDGDRLWLMLRALDLPRETIARIALTLSDADHRRDIDAFADVLDAIAAVPAETARASLAALSYPRAFRDALQALRHG